MFIGNWVCPDFGLDRLGLFLVGNRYDFAGVNEDELELLGRRKLDACGSVFLGIPSRRKVPFLIHVAMTIYLTDVEVSTLPCGI